MVGVIPANVIPAGSRGESSVGGWRVKAACNYCSRLCLRSESPKDLMIVQGEELQLGVILYILPAQLSLAPCQRPFLLPALLEPLKTFVAFGDTVLHPFLTVVECSWWVVVCYKESQDKREAAALLDIQELCFLMRICSENSRACGYILCLQPWRSTPCGSCNLVPCLVISHRVSRALEPDDLQQLVLLYS